MNKQDLEKAISLSTLISNYEHQIKALEAAISEAKQREGLCKMIGEDNEYPLNLDEHVRLSFYFANRSNRELSFPKAVQFFEFVLEATKTALKTFEREFENL
jgi:hypothetical protein